MSTVQLCVLAAADGRRERDRSHPKPSCTIGANSDPHRRFDDLFNLVADPAFLMMAWARVRNNTGARSAGVDGQTAYYVERERGTAAFLSEVRDQLKSRTFRPLPVKERMIPKPGTRKKRRLGIPTVTDRVVQASLKLVLEPIFEADFRPVSYGFRPMRRAHDAIAETRHFTSHPRNYEWVVEGDITACFDEISHPALMDRVRVRVGDKRVLALVKVFLKAGILTQDRQVRDTNTGTPQGGILSPLLSGIGLSVLDDHFVGQWNSWSQWRRAERVRKGLGVWRFIRYADDFVILVRGQRHHAEALRDEAAAVLVPRHDRLTRQSHTHLSGLDVMVWRWRLPRHPEVFVRELSMAEGQRLQKITRTARDPIRLRRATVVLMSAQGQAVGDIVDLLHIDEGYVRDVIHAFNQRGFDALDPKWSGGRPAAVDATIRQQILAMAKADPPSLGLPFATWSLPKLAAHLARDRICRISRETLRRILRGAGVSWQRTKTWKASNARSSWPRCCASSTCTTTRPPTGG